MSISAGSGFPPVATFPIVHPNMPDAGPVVCDDASFPAWAANGWVKADEAPTDAVAVDDAAPKRKGKG